MRVPLRHKQSHWLVDVRPEGGTYRVAIEGMEHVVEVCDADETFMSLDVDGRRYHIAVARNGRERLVAVAGEAYSMTTEGSAGSASVALVASPEVIAPMPGKVLQVLVQAGDSVAPGDGLLLLEAMKMESRLTAEADATVVEVRVAAGDMVVGGQVLIVLSYDDETNQG
jgi:3-methylcrotonyl-CoA carboxylase alpha subunit